MKTIDQTNDGGYLVKMTASEHKELYLLAQAVEGKTIDEINSEQFLGYQVKRLISCDLDNVFGAIQAFTEAKFRTNEIEQLLHALKRAVERQNEHA